MYYDKNIELDSKVRYTTKGTKKVVLENVNGTGFDLGGALNLTTSELGTAPSLSIDSVPIQDFIGDQTVVTAPGDKTLNETDSHILCIRQAGASKDINLILPYISSLTTTKRYHITFAGDLRPSSSTTDSYYISITCLATSEDVTIGDTYDHVGKGSVVWVCKVPYTSDGSVVIQSVLALNPGKGTTNGWAIVSSHFDKSKNFKDHARLASTANIALASVVEGGTIDGKALQVHDRVLLKDQTTPAENGLYTVRATDPPWRSNDLYHDSYASGAHIPIVEGTANGGKVFRISNTTETSKVGTDNLTLTEFGALTPPGGSNTEIQFNDSGAFGGISDLTWDGTDLTISTDKKLKIGGVGYLQDFYTVYMELLANGVDFDISCGSGNVLNLGSSAGSGSSITTGAINIGSGLTTGDITLGKSGQTGKINVINTTDSSSGISGALVVDGGLGVAKKIMTDGSLISMSGNNPIISTTSGTGDFQLQSNVGVNGRLCSTTTTGSVIIGQALTSGDITLGNASQTGIVDITSELRLSNKGTVVQLTSVTTPVTINKPLGVITTVALTLANNTNATFTVNNTYALADSVVLVSLIGYAGSGNLNCECTSRSAGSFDITIMNTGGGTLNALAKISYMLF